MLRTRLLEAIPTEEDAVVESGFDVSMLALGSGELTGWLAENAGPGTGSVCTRSATGGPAPAT